MTTPLTSFPGETSERVAALRSLVERAKPRSMVFFGGAGVSTESGIPDFRSPDGLYAQKFRYPPETMLSRSFFDTHTAEFFDFYFDRVLFLGAQPNRAHRKLAQLEMQGTVSAVVTQNIDGLHQAAGSRTVHELHGSIMRNYCMNCGNFVDAQGMLQLRSAADESGGKNANAATNTRTDSIAASSASASKRTTPTRIPRCPQCGGIMKPDVVLYEEPLDGDVLEAAAAAIAQADVMLVAGTSLAVNPAAGLLRYFQGSHLAIVNKSPTPRDRAADLLIPASIGDVLDW